MALKEELALVSTRMFGHVADRTEDSMGPLKSALVAADMRILYRTYASIIFFLTLTSFLVTIPAAAIISILLRTDLLTMLLLILGAPVLVAITAFFVAYTYPFSHASSRRKDIEMNLPFAINHIAAIAGSGVPSSIIFKLLTGFTEYGEVSSEAKKIVRNIDIFGQDVTTAMRQVADKTPSKPFKELLEGMISSIETGGNLQLFLKNQAEKSLFEYRLRRERYLEILSTYADFYTAVMIAAPLFLVAILAIMNMIGGQIYGMNIQDVMWLGIWLVIPLVNIGFLIFIHFTQPEL